VSVSEDRPTGEAGTDSRSVLAREAHPPTELQRCKMCTPCGRGRRVVHSTCATAGAGRMWFWPPPPGAAGFTPLYVQPLCAKWTL